MIRALALAAVVALAGCGPPEAQTSARAPKEGPPAAASPANPDTAEPDLLTRWRTLLIPGRLAAEYSKSETDAVWARMECRDGVLVLTEIHADPTWEAPKAIGGVYYDLALRARNGPQLVAATAIGSVVEGDLEMQFHLPAGTFDLADSWPDLELVLKNNKTSETVATAVNDVARDVLMACAPG